MIQLISKRIRWYSTSFMMVWLLQCFFPALSLALTSGPTMPEVYQFQMASTTDMVNIFDGSFSYNIPLFEVPGPNGGYPINLAYQSGITMEQEATWVGLGWNLNVGAINRQMRGLPDDFKGTPVTRDISMKPNYTAGVKFDLGGEIAGLPKNVSAGYGIGRTIYYNSYGGLGMSTDLNGSLGVSLGPVNASIAGGVGFDSQGASPTAYISPTVGLSTSAEKNMVTLKGSLGATATFDAFEGMRSFGFNSNLSASARTLHFNEKGTDGVIGGAGAGSNLFSSNINLAHPGYTPSMSFNTKSISTNLGIKLGGAAEFLFLSAGITGTFSNQYVGAINTNKDRITNNGYGSLYMGDALLKEGEDALFDFNREKDGPVQNTNNTIHTLQQTFDIYSVTGQGIGGQFRPESDSWIWMGDPITTNEGFTAELEGEFGFPSHVGGNGAITNIDTYSKFWKDPYSNFSSEKATAGIQMRAYGETSITKHNATTTGDFKLFHTETPYAIDIAGSDMDRGEKEGHIESAISSLKLTGADLKTIDYTTSEWASKDQSQAQTQIQAFTIDQIDDLNIPYLPSITHDAKTETGAGLTGFRDQIGAYIVTNPSGMRYVYGDPLYNTVQKEHMFTRSEVKRVSGQYPQYENVSNSAMSSIRAKGRDEFDETKTIEDYAYSYLLTAVLGPDYVDVTNDGLTEDDLGYWVKFNYHNHTDYDWRLPFSGIKQDVGIEDDKEDDKGNYTEGKKQITYLESIETATHKATFITSVRRDGKGTSSSSNSKKLDEIKLQVKTSNETLQKVHFQYDYRLCQGVDNHVKSTSTTDEGGTGKLSLRKLWFEYGESSRGALTPYEFKYSKINPRYQADGNNVDRWGYYRIDDDDDGDDNDGDITSFRDFPYTVQNEEKLLQGVGAWCLNEVVLPSGSSVKVTYEPHDYAYVQDKQATEMVKIEGLSLASTSYNTNQIITPTVSSDVFDGNNDNLLVCVEVNEKLHSLDAKGIASRLLDYDSRGKANLYFRVHAKYMFKEATGNIGEEEAEYITGYAKVKRLLKGSNNKVFIELEPYKGFHPFSYAAWEFLRYSYQSKIAKLQGGDIESFFRKIGSKDILESLDQITRMADIFSELYALIEGYHKWARSRSLFSKIDIKNSYVKLKSWKSENDNTNLVKKKYAGGGRVKQLTMSDGWGGKNEALYGQAYYYRMIDEDGSLSSSGVAAYEPMIGGEENAVRTIESSNDYPFANGSGFLREYPYNEGVFPGAQIGYSQVTVMSLMSATALKKYEDQTKLYAKILGNLPIELDLLDGDNIVSNVFENSTSVDWGTTGAQVHEFYTAKDFPVKLKRTVLTQAPHRKNINLLLFNETIDFNHASQGFTAVTNDMHGKPKKMSYYGQNANGSINETKPIAYTQYTYKTKDGDPKELNNDIDVVEIKETPNKPNSLELQKSVTGSTIYRMGENVDVWVDSRHYYTNIYRYTAEGNVYFSLALGAGVVPVPVPIPYYSEDITKNDLRQTVINKLINKTGILASTESYKEGNKVSVENLYWHKDNGQVAIQKTTDRYGEEIYSLNVPGYMVYSNMGLASENQGTILSLSGFSQKGGNSQWYVSSQVTPSNKLIKGDELSFGSEIFVYQGKDMDNTGVEKDLFYRKSKNSTPFAETSGDAFIFRSGNRNFITQSIGSYSFKIKGGATLESEFNKLFTTTTKQRSIFSPVISSPK